MIETFASTLPSAVTTPGGMAVALGGGTAMTLTLDGGPVAGSDSAALNFSAAPSTPADLFPGTLVWDAVRFPPENGDDPVSLATSTAGENGMLHLPNTSNIFKTIHFLKMLFDI